MAKKTKVQEFVLDGSVSLAWYFKDEATQYADAVAACFPRMQGVVPPIWPLEVANAIVTGERRKRSTPIQAAKWLSYLGSLPILVDDVSSSRAWTDVVPLARTHDLTAYDAAYLELALRRGLALASLDTKLKSAAKAVGLVLFRP